MSREVQLSIFNQRNWVDEKEDRKAMSSRTDIIVGGVDSRNIAISLIEGF